MIRNFLAAAFLIAGAMTPALGQAAQGTIASGDFAAINPAMPQRERDFLNIIGEARDRYKVARTVGSQADVRMAMQVRVIDFVTVSADAQRWLGIVKGVGTTREGDFWIDVEIAPDITISTSQNLAADPEHVTLIRPGSPVAKAAGGIGIGQKITFSGNLVRYLITTDDGMIERPQLYAHFSDIKPLQQ